MKYIGAVLGLLVVVGGRSAAGQVSSELSKAALVFTMTVSMAPRLHHKAFGTAA